MKKLLLGLFLALGLVGLAGCGETYVSHSHSHVVHHVYHSHVVHHVYHAPVVHHTVVHHVVHRTSTVVHHVTTSRPTLSLRKR